MTTKKQNNNQSKSGKVFTGTVVSDKMQGTLVVAFDYKHMHSVYKKTIRRRHKIYVDNNLNAKKGDTVKVRESRPLSKTKRFITLEIIESARQLK
ncbi:30S ribosomal protein S17 [Patescibacteria group bacterium]|nr:30S ribosomal protein S17 [Patescibacteria group bacterium]